MIKTCPGRPSIFWVVGSLFAKLELGSFRIYVFDEAPVAEDREILYDWLRNKGHYVHIGRPHTPVGVARNFLVECLDDEEQVLRLDDDFEVGGEFELDSLATVLWSERDIGFCSDLERQIGAGKSVVSGALRPAGGDISIRKRTLRKIFHRPGATCQVASGVRFRRADFTRNLLLIKREVLEVVKWSESLEFVGEHLEFMMSCKESGFSGAYTLDSIHLHRDDLAQLRTEVRKGNARPGEDIFGKMLSDRWGCSTVRSVYPFSIMFRHLVSRLL